MEFGLVDEVLVVPSRPDRTRCLGEKQNGHDDWAAAGCDGSRNGGRELEMNNWHAAIGVWCGVPLASGRASLGFDFGWSPSLLFSRVNTSVNLLMK